MGACRVGGRGRGGVYAKGTLASMDPLSRGGQGGEGGRIVAVMRWVLLGGGIGGLNGPRERRAGREEGRCHTQ